MSYNKIQADIKAGKFAPVYLFMGEEPFFIDQLSSLIEKTALSEDLKGFNQTILYGSDTNVEQIVNSARSFPMMGDRQVLIIKEAQSLEKKIQDLKIYCAQPSETTILVINYKQKKLDKRTELYKLIEKNGVVFNSETIRDYKIAAWITDHAKSLKINMDDRLANLLGSYLGTDLSRIHTELIKLQGIAKDKEITDELIEKYVGISKEYNIFEFQKAVLNRNYALALKITSHYTHNPKSMHIIQAIGSLYNIFTRWIKFYYLKDKSKTNAIQAGVTAFFHRDYQNSLQQYSIAEIISNLRILKEFDLKAKGMGSSGSDTEGEFIEMVQRLLLK